MKQPKINYSERAMEALIRYAEGATFAEVGKAMVVTRQRAWQLHMQAIARIRHQPGTLEALAPDIKEKIYARTHLGSGE